MNTTTAPPATTPSFELALYRTLDSVVAPMVRNGIFSPGPIGPGLVVVETVGRRSAMPRPVVLMGFAIGDVVLVSTVGGEQAQWVKNLAAQREVRWGRWGRRTKGHATVVAPGTVGRVPVEAPAWVDDLVAALEPWVLTGWRFAVLTPDAARDTW
jgi:deazaflavin-dependent oxidoreductase (nitroreductase family)